MRRLLILVLIGMGLMGCESKLNMSLYISSIGFEVEEDKLMMYFLCNPLNDIIRSEKSELKTEYFVIEAESITDGFEKVQEAIPFDINYMHLQTVIFHKDFLASDKLPLFLNFMKESRIVTYNFYCFASEKSIEDIFDYESPETISFQHSLLASPSSVDYSLYGVERVHFLALASDFYDNNRFLHLPIIDLRDSLNDKKILTISGYVSISNELNFYRLDEFYAMHFLYDQDFLFYDCYGKTFELRNYRFYHDVIDGEFTFLVRFTPLNASEKEKNALKKNIESAFVSYFEEYIINEGGLYLIDEYNYLNKKALNALKYRIIILIW